MWKKSLKTVWVAVCSLIAFVAIVSCHDNVGLGDQVDTEVPTLHITSPDTGVAAGGTGGITVQGSCNDDKGVTRIAITIKNVVTEEVTSLGDATIVDSTSWSIVFNAYDEALADNAYNGYPYPDGTYEVNAIAYDAAGHTSGTASRSFDVDNTPPVFAITKPNSLLIGDPASYGRTVTIAGEIADDHAIQSMDIQLYQYDAATQVATDITDTLAQTQFTGFETAGGTSVQIAQYYTEETAPTDEDSDEYKLYKNYVAMYAGAQAGDTVSLYLKINLTDVAGNVSENTYISSKLKTLIKDETDLASTSTTLQTAQFKKILNGTYTLDELTADQQRIVKSILLGTYDTQTAYLAVPSEANEYDLAMSINSDASPKFEVAGCLLKEESGEYTWNEANSEGTLSIKVSAGLDGWGVIPSSLKAALFQCDSTGTLVNSEATTFKYEDATMQLTAENITNNTGTSVAEINTTVDMASYNLHLPALSSSKYYLVYVYGQDEDGQAITADNKYGFKVTPQGMAPVVEADDKYFVRASSVVEDGYTLLVKVNDPLDVPDVHLPTDNAEYSEQGVSYKIEVYDRYIAQKNAIRNYTPLSDIDSRKKILTGSAITQSETNVHDFTTAIPLTLPATLSADNYTIAVTVSAANSSDTSSEAIYLVWADNKAPAVQITNADFVSAISEDGSTTYETIWNNTTGGLITENSSFYANNAESPTYKVAGLWNDENGSGTATLYYSTSADTMPEVTITAGKASVADSNWTAFTNDDGVTAGLTDSVRWSYDFPVAEGSDKLFSFFAVDAVGNVSDIITYKNITFDFAVPVITINTTPQSPTNAAVTVEGVITESRLINKNDITITAINGDATIPGTVTMDGDSTSGTVAFTVAIPADSGDGTWKVVANAKDASGRVAAEKSVSFVLDATKPTELNNDEHSWQVAKKGYDSENWYNTPALRVSGYYKDETSGIAAVYAQVISAEAENPTHLDAENYESAENVTSFATSAVSGEDGVYTFETTLSGFVSGTNTLHLLAVDTAGNVSAIKTMVLKLDQESPTVEASDSKIMTNGSASFTISGTASDDASDIAAIALYLVKAGSVYELRTTTSEYGAITLSKASDYAENKLNWTWVATVTPTTKIGEATSQWFDENELGSTPSVYAVVTDTAGNTTTAKVTTLSVDTTEPTTRISSPLASISLNGRASIMGAVTENQTPKSVALYYTDADTPPVTLADWTLFKKITTQTADESDDDAETAAKTTYEADVSLIYGFTLADFNFTTLSHALETENGKKNLHLLLVAEDEAGNVSVNTDELTPYAAKDSSNPNAGGSGYYTYTVDLDTDRPVVKVMNLSADAATIMYATNAALNGTITDDDADENTIVKTFALSTQSITAASDVTIAAADGSTGFSVKSSTGTVTITPANGHTYAVVKHTISGEEYYDVTDIDLASGTWTFTPYDTTDGTKTVYMYIEDNEDSVFYTRNDSVLSSPKIQYTTGSVTNNTAAFAYTSDSGAPTVTTKTLNYASNAAGTAGIGTIANVQAASVVGGNRRYVQFEVTAQDASGIKEMYMTVKDTDGRSTTLRTPGASGTDGSESGTFTANDTDAPNIWKTGWIDLGSYNGDDNNKWATGNGTAVITVVDQSGLNGSDNISFTIDNAAPFATVTSPKSTAINKSGVTIAGTAGDTGLALLKSVRYLIPEKDQYTAATEAAIIANVDDWTAFDGDENASIWSLTITDSAMGTATTMEYENGAYTHDGGPGTVYCNPEVYASTTDDHIIYTVPFYVRVEDTVGNVSVTKYSIRYNPFDTPEATITYPASSDYDTGNAYVTLGGTIRVTGGATDGQSVYGVYVQVAVDATETTNAYDETVYGTDADFSLTSSRTIKNAAGEDTTTTNKAFLESAGYTIVTKALLQAELAANAEYSSDEMKVVSNMPEDWWGIKATQANTSGSTNWNLSLNASNQFDIKDSTRKIALRVTAVNTTAYKTHFVSGYSDAVAISVDVSAPSIDVVQMAQYTGTPSLTATETASSDYTEDMYLRGNWYFVADILDESGISEWSVTEVTTTSARTIGEYRNGSQSGDVYADRLEKTDDREKLGYRLFVPVNANVTEVSYTVSVTDTPTESGGTSHTTTKSYSFNIDNIAPVMASLTGNGTALLEANENGIAKTTTSGVRISNSNYAYTIAGELTEEGSGFERLAFYFLRDEATLSSPTDKVSRIYDVMQAYTATNTASRVNTADLTAKTVTQDSSNSYTLYGKEYTGTIEADGSTYTFAASGIGDNTHIRVGGLIYVGGMYRRITAKSGNTVTFDTKAAAATGATAFFPYAQVVDNTQTEKTNRNSSNRYTIANDDGDDMPEMVSKAGTTYNWEAVVYSDYIPDGPITLVCLAFDKAGNVSGTKIVTAIQNNAPRIARLYLGTDLNGDGTYTYTASAKDSEFNVYTFAELNELQPTLVDKYQESVEFETADATYNYNKPFRIINGFAVMPEFTGGNGDIKLVFNNDSASNEGFVTSESVAQSAFYAVSTANVIAGDGAIAVLSDSSTKAKDSLKKYVINDANLTSIADGTDKAMSFTFWDSTEGTVCGEDSNYCYVRVTDLNVDLVDDVTPNQVINPFYWNSLTDNSVYGSANATKPADLQGHIELASDLTTDVTTLYGSDPKVSGKITMRGYAYDDQRLDSLWFAFDGFTPTGYLTNDDSGKRTVGGKTFYEAAYYTPTTGEWTVSSATMATNGWEFTLDDTSEDAYFSQDGHKVLWTLSIDTQKISGTAGVDKCARVIALDHSNNVSSTMAAITDKTDGNYNVPTYQMDVVPYVRGIKTGLSVLKQNNSSVYDRTARGHYTANATESVYFYGFNIAAGATVYDYTGKTTTLSAAGTKYGQVDCYAAASVKNFTSGEIYVTVNDIRSLNNMNKNDARGVYASTTDSATGDYTVYQHYYNRQPNNDSNNLLTDDLVLDVWAINSSAAPTISGRVDQPIMKINPATGQLNFAYANGSLYFTMGSRLSSGDTTSYDYWMASYDFFTSIGYTVDKLGYAYGVAAGGDINSDSSDNFVLATGRWGVGGRTNRGSYDGTNSLRLEQIAQKDNSGTSVFNKTRIMSPSLASAVHGTTTDLYLAYYDDINNEIRVRKGATNSTSKTNFGTFIDRYTYHVSGGNSPVQNYDYNKADVTLIAGGTTGYIAGEYVSLAVVSAEGATIDDVLVLIWYDSTSRVLYYTYNTKPLEMPTGGSGYSGSNAFATPTQVFSDVAVGEYCKIAVDKNGGIHVVAYDSSNCDVKYAYKSAYNAGSWTEYTVDSYGIIGSELMLDVAYDSTNGNPVPYIGYYASSAVRPKLAYLATPAVRADGVANDAYTGVWETSYVPTSSSVPQDHINVGIWKNNGVITTGVTSCKTFRNATETTPSGGTTRTAKQDGNGTIGYNATQWGYAFGNGTANPILGYQIKVGTNGTIETAQMQ